MYAWSKTRFLEPGARNLFLLTVRDENKGRYNQIYALTEMQVSGGRNRSMCSGMTKKKKKEGKKKKKGSCRCSRFYTLFDAQKKSGNPQRGNTDNDLRSGERAGTTCVYVEEERKVLYDLI